MTHKQNSTPAISALAGAGVEYTIRPYHHEQQSTDYGREAAAALGVGEDMIFKTLICDTGAGLVVALVPASGQLDLKALAAVVGVKKVILADPKSAQRSSGYVVGGISPLGQRTILPTVVDAGATGRTIMVSAGRRGLQVELSGDDLIELTGALVAPISR